MGAAKSWHRRPGRGALDRAGRGHHRLALGRRLLRSPAPQRGRSPPASGPRGQQAEEAADRERAARQQADEAADRERTARRSADEAAGEARRRGDAERWERYRSNIAAAAAALQQQNTSTARLHSTPRPSRASQLGMAALPQHSSTAPGSLSLYQVG